MHPQSRFFYRFSQSWNHPGMDYGFSRRHWHRRPSRLLWFTIGAASATWYIMRHDAEQSDKANYWKNCYRPPVQQPRPQNNGDFSRVLGDPLPTVPGNDSGAPPSPSPYPYSHPHHHSHWGWGFAKERSFQYPPSPPPPPPPPPSAAHPPNGPANLRNYGQAPSDSALPTVPTESLSGPASTPGAELAPTPTPTPVAAAIHTQTVPWGFESSYEHQKKEWEQEREKLLAKAQDTMVQLSESTLDSLSSTVEALKAKLAEHRVKREEQQKLIDKELEEQKKKPVRYV
ncbi:hypothetical protein F5877DRAFT_71951 [Lentinula edodes]|nr:hypothetical protein F5877DRAFT_71951 [Lentinula edodes]